MYSHFGYCFTLIIIIFNVFSIIHSQTIIHAASLTKTDSTDQFFSVRINCNGDECIDLKQLVFTFTDDEKDFPTSLDIVTIATSKASSSSSLFQHLELIQPDITSSTIADITLAFDKADNYEITFFITFSNTLHPPSTPLNTQLITNLHINTSTITLYEYELIATWAPSLALDTNTGSTEIDPTEFSTTITPTIIHPSSSPSPPPNTNIYRFGFSFTNYNKEKVKSIDLVLTGVSYWYSMIQDDIIRDDSDDDDDDIINSYNYCSFNGIWLKPKNISSTNQTISFIIPDYLDNAMAHGSLITIHCGDERRNLQIIQPQTHLETLQSNDITTFPETLSIIVTYLNHNDNNINKGTYKLSLRPELIDIMNKNNKIIITPSGYYTDRRYWHNNSTIAAAVSVVFEVEFSNSKDYLLPIELDIEINGIYNDESKSDLAYKANHIIVGIAPDYGHEMIHKEGNKKLKQPNNFELVTTTFILPIIEPITWKIPKLNINDGFMTTYNDATLPPENNMNKKGLPKRIIHVIIPQIPFSTNFPATINLAIKLGNDGNDGNDDNNQFAITSGSILQGVSNDNRYNNNDKWEFGIISKNNMIEFDLEPIMDHDNTTLEKAISLYYPDTVQISAPMFRYAFANINTYSGALPKCIMMHKSCNTNGKCEWKEDTSQIIHTLTMSQTRIEFEITTLSSYIPSLQNKIVCPHSHLIEHKFKNFNFQDSLTTVVYTQDQSVSTSWWSLSTNPNVGGFVSQVLKRDGELIAFNETSRLTSKLGTGGLVFIIVLPIVGVLALSTVAIICACKYK